MIYTDMKYMSRHRYIDKAYKGIHTHTHKHILAKITIAVIKHDDQSNLGIKGFIWITLPHHSSLTKEVRIEQTSQEPGGRS